MIAKIKFNEIVSRRESGEQSGLAQTEAFVFQKAINSTMVAVLPILSKVQHGKFILQDYLLKEVQMDALSSSIEHLGTPDITRIFLDNCRVSDHMLANLLHKLVNQNKLEEFIYKRNEFKEKALIPLLQIVQIQPPFQLQELRLVDCDTSPHFV